MTRFLASFLLSLMTFPRQFHGTSGQSTGEQWWNSVSPWNPPPGEGQAADPGGTDSWNPDMDPNFQTLGVVGPSGISVVSDTGSESAGNAQNVPDTIPPPNNENALPPREQAGTSPNNRQNSVSLNNPSQTSNSGVGDARGINQATPSGRRRLGGQGRQGRQGRRRNNARSQDGSSAQQQQGARTNRRGGRRRFGNANQETPSEVSSTPTDSNSGSQPQDQQTSNQNSGRRRFGNNNNRRPGQRNRNRNVQETNTGEPASPITSSNSGNMRRDRFGSLTSSNSPSDNAGISRIQNSQNQAQTQQGNRAKECDGRGGNVKDSSGKITHIISTHDCSLLEVIDSPLTGGHVVDPITGELIFAVEQQSFLDTTTTSPPSAPNVGGNIGTGGGAGLTAIERQRVREQRRQERLQRQQERQQRRRERQQRQMERQRLRDERLRQRQERQQARNAAMNTPTGAGSTSQRDINNNMRNMGGNQNRRRRTTTTTTSTTTTTPTTTTTTTPTTTTTTTTTTTPTPPQRQRSSRRSTLQRIARPLNRQFGNLLSSIMPGLNQQLGLAPIRMNTNRRRTNVRRPRIRNLNMGNLFSLFG